ncbi:MAG: HAD-IIB family hydrolase [Vicinamibacteraceae bacterium]
MIIFSDLDGSLLDEATYGWEAARPALDAVRRRSIPLVLASSKTRAEMVSLASDLGLTGDSGLRDPLIIENGGGLLLSADSAVELWPDGISTDDGWLVALGTPVAALRDALMAIADECGVRVRGFSTMTDDEIAALTSLSRDAIAPARQREFDEPFVLTDVREPLDIETERYHEALKCVQQAAKGRGLRVTHGGRLLHLTGDVDKGRAAALVLRWYAETGAVPVSAALGDSPNDLSLLQLVDQPIIIPRQNGRPDPDLMRALPHATVAPAPGPAGWNHAVQALLAKVGAASSLR